MMVDYGMPGCVVCEIPPRVGRGLDLEWRTCLVWAMEDWLTDPMLPGWVDAEDVARRLEVEGAAHPSPAVRRLFLREAALLRRAGGRVRVHVDAYARWSAKRSGVGRRRVL